MDNARAALPPEARLVDGVPEAADRAQALILLTEWPEIVDSDWRLVARCMIPPRLLFDGRNALPASTLESLGFEYVGVGR